MVDTFIFRMIHEKSDGAAGRDRRNVLRQTLRNARASLSTHDVDRYSIAIARRAYPLVCHAQRLAGYFALGSEVDIAPLLEQCRNNDQLTYAPLINKGNTMGFARFDENTDIALNRYGIKEPVADESDHLQAAQLDAVLVPMVGFDTQCNRMGMGGGYYDRSFAHRRSSQATAKAKPLLVGVAFDLQGVESVHADWWDVPLDYIVTQTRTLQRGSVAPT